MRSTPGWGDPKAPLPPEDRVATPTATFEFPFAWITLSVPDSDWLDEGSEGGAGQVTEIGTSMPSDARVAGELTETAMPESADAATGRSPSNRTGVSAPNRKSRFNIIGHLIRSYGRNGADTQRKAVSNPVSPGFQNWYQRARPHRLVSARGLLAGAKQGDPGDLFITSCSNQAKGRPQIPTTLDRSAAISNMNRSFRAFWTGVLRVRDREAPGSNPGPPTKSDT